MIAQSQEPQERDDPPAMVFARRLVAARLLSRHSRPGEEPRRIVAWKLWLVMAALAAVVAACATHWLGIW